MGNGIKRSGIWGEISGGFYSVYRFGGLVAPSRSLASPAVSFCPSESSGSGAGVFSSSRFPLNASRKLYGYTAQQTLDYIQLLYEKRLATYPRTDSRYLTEDMAGMLPGLCGKVAGAFPSVSGFCGAVKADQVTDSSKVSDHYAIIPTKGVAGADLGSLPTGEKNILTMVSFLI